MMQFSTMAPEPAPEREEPVLRDTPVRPRGDTIDPNCAESVRAWALWLELEEDILVHLVGIVGSSVGQIEYVLGKKPRARW
jgi:hypothetical protein